MQWWFKKFYKGGSVQSLVVDNDQLRASSKLILLQLCEKLLKNSMSIILWSFSIWSKLERWKSSISEYLMNWLKIKKKIILKYHILLFYATTMNYFPIRLWHVMKCWFYATTSNYQLSSWTENKLKIISPNQICTKIKGHGHCLVVCYWSDPL